MSFILNWVLEVKTPDGWLGIACRRSNINAPINSKKMFTYDLFVNLGFREPTEITSFALVGIPDDASALTKYEIKHDRESFGYGHIKALDFVELYNKHVGNHNDRQPMDYAYTFTDYHKLFGDLLYYETDGMCDAIDFHKALETRFVYWFS